MGKRTQKIRLKKNRSKRNLSKRNNTRRSNIRKKASFMRGGMKGKDKTTGFSVASSDAFANMQPYDEDDEMPPRERRRLYRDKVKTVAEVRQEEQEKRRQQEEAAQRLNQLAEERKRLGEAIKRTAAMDQRVAEMTETMKNEIITIINKVPYETLKSIHRFADGKNQDHERHVKYAAN